jgi:deoxyribodipyrimidine photo-lyase
MSHPPTAVAWFRRDLRVHDHPALAVAGTRFDRVAPLFVLDERLLSSRVPSANRAWFMGRSVAELAETLAVLGAELSVLRGDPAELVVPFAQAVGAHAIIVSRDYSPYGRRRDGAVAAAAAKRGIEMIAEPGLLVHEPEEVTRGDGGGFVIFSPFHRAWERLVERPVLTAPTGLRGVARRAWASTAIHDLLGPVVPTADPTLMPAPGEAAARVRLEAWTSSPALLGYDTSRDRLDLDGTSRLSQDLRWGLISPVEALAAVAQAATGPDAVGAARPATTRTTGPAASTSTGGATARAAATRPGPARFRTEVAWRDFYAHLLWHHPDLARHALRSEFEAVARSSDGALAEAWRQGWTGYPVVDAAMRQLLATGWMHNRARMVVASFLTKHLGLDWRVGAAHFMEHLLDGDVASNAGGWQWAASTGADAQPWFRVLNPALQGRRHDPDGEYVRRWVPELAARKDLQRAAVHEPPPGTYVAQVVDHATGRGAALAAYRSAARGARRTPQG